MNRWVWLALLTIVLVPALFGCSTESSAPSRELKMAPASALPKSLQNQPTAVREAYLFAMANAEVLEQIPCYCGCGSVGHTSNYMCYVKEARADGSFVFDDHAVG